MSVVQKYCPKGHAYDPSLPACPFCPPGAGQNLGATMPLNPVNAGQQYVPSASPVNQPLPPTTPAFQQVPPTGALMQSSKANVMSKPTEYLGDLNTQSVGTAQKQSNRVRPVVGWLVCVQGPDIGKDFRLHTHFNRVGRLEGQDVQLTDNTVSRDNHFTVTYDMLNHRYFAEMGNGSTLVYVNGQSLGARAMLKKGDQIKVGESLLVFIPLEQQDVKWNWKI